MHLAQQSPTPDKAAQNTLLVTEGLEVIRNQTAFQYENSPQKPTPENERPHHEQVALEDFVVQPATTVQEPLQVFILGLITLM